MPGDLMTAPAPTETPGQLAPQGPARTQDVNVVTLPRVSAPTWSPSDSLRASIEGWDILDNPGASNGPYLLQKRSDCDRFENDPAAWRHVCTRAAAGSDLHTRALEFLKRKNLQEYKRVVENTATLPLPSRFMKKEETDA